MSNFSSQILMFLEALRNVASEFFNAQPDRRMLSTCQMLGVKITIMPFCDVQGHPFAEPSYRFDLTSADLLATINTVADEQELDACMEAETGSLEAAGWSVTVVSSCRKNQTYSFQWICRHQALLEELVDIQDLSCDVMSSLDGLMKLTAVAVPGSRIGVEDLHSTLSLIRYKAQEVVDGLSKVALREVCA